MKRSKVLFSYFCNRNYKKRIKKALIVLLLNYNLINYYRTT